MFVLKLLSTYLRLGVHCWPKYDGEKSKIGEFGGERTTCFVRDYMSEDLLLLTLGTCLLRIG